MAQLSTGTNKGDLPVFVARKLDLNLTEEGAPGEGYNYMYVAANNGNGCIPSRQSQQLDGNIPHTLQGATDNFASPTTFNNFCSGFKDPRMDAAFAKYLECEGILPSIFNRYSTKLYGLEGCRSDTFPQLAALNDIESWLKCNGGDAAIVAMVRGRLDERDKELKTMAREKIKLLRGNSTDNAIVKCVKELYDSHVERLENRCTLEDFKRMFLYLKKVGSITFQELLDTNTEFYLRAVQLLVAEVVSPDTPVNEETKSTLAATEYFKNGLDPCEFNVPERYKNMSVQAALFHMMTLMQNQTQSAIAQCSHPGCHNAVAPTVEDFATPLEFLLSLEDVLDDVRNRYTSKENVCIFCPLHRNANARTSTGYPCSEDEEGYAQLDPPFRPTVIETEEGFTHRIGQILDTGGSIHEDDIEAFYQSLGTEGRVISLKVALDSEITVISMAQFRMPSTSSIFSVALCRNQGGDPRMCDVCVGTNRTPECEAKCGASNTDNEEKEQLRKTSSLNHIFVKLNALLASMPKQAGSSNPAVVGTLLRSAEYQIMPIRSKVSHSRFVIRTLVTTEGLLPRGQTFAGFIEDMLEANCTGNIRRFVPIHPGQQMIAFKLSRFSPEAAVNGNFETMLGSVDKGPLLTPSAGILIAGLICSQEPTYVDGDSKMGNIAIGLNERGDVISVSFFDDESQFSTGEIEESRCTRFILNPVDMEMQYLSRSVHVYQRGPMDENIVRLFLQALVPLATEFPKCSDTNFVDLFMAALYHLMDKVGVHVPNLNGREAFQQLLGFDGEIPSVGLPLLDTAMLESSRSVLEFAGWSPHMALVLSVIFVLRQNDQDIDVSAVLECLRREIPEALKIMAENINQRLARSAIMAIACTDREEGEVITDDTGISISREQWVKGPIGEAVDALLAALNLKSDAVPNKSVLPSAAHKWPFMVTRQETNNVPKSKKARTRMLEAMLGGHMAGVEGSASSAPVLMESFFQFVALQCALEQQSANSKSKVPLIVCLLDFAIKRYSTSLMIGVPLQKHYTEGNTMSERVWNAWLNLMHAAATHTLDVVSRFASAVVTHANEPRTFLEQVPRVVNTAVASIGNHFHLFGQDTELLQRILRGTVSRIHENFNPELTPPQLITLTTSSMYRCMANIERRMVDNKRKSRHDSDTDSDDN